MDKIAVLIPCYNEELTIAKVVNDFKTVLPEAIIYVYDNNSTDNSVSLATAAGAIVRHEYRQGKGNVIRRMFREIDAEAYIMVDADDTYPVEVSLLHALEIFRDHSVFFSGITMVAAWLMFVSGVILSTLRQKDCKDFEFNLVHVDWMKKRNDQVKNRSCFGVISRKNVISYSAQLK